MKNNDKTGGATVPIGLPHQDPATGFCIPKSAAAPQHGQKADAKTARRASLEQRTFQPRPGH